MGDDALVMGAVAYDPKVVTIWDGFRAWLRAHDLPFDYVLYSNYERQVEDLVAGRIHAAWNSPLAWVRSRRLAGAAGVKVAAIAMRDTDRGLTSLVATRADGDVAAVEDLRGRVVGVGAVDSPRRRSSRSPISPTRASSPASTSRSDASMWAWGCTETTSAASARPPGRWSPARWTRPA